MRSSRVLTSNDKVATVLGPPIPASSDTLGGVTDEAVGNKERLLYCILWTGDCPRWVIKKKSWICWQVAKKGHLGAESCLRIRMLNLLLNHQFLLINAHNVQRILHCRHYIKQAKCILFFQEREKCSRILGNIETLAASFANWQSEIGSRALRAAKKTIIPASPFQMIISTILYMYCTHVLRPS